MLLCNMLVCKLYATRSTCYRSGFGLALMCEQVRSVWCRGWGELDLSFTFYYFIYHGLSGVISAIGRDTVIARTLRDCLVLKQVYCILPLPMFPRLERGLAVGNNVSVVVSLSFEATSGSPVFPCSHCFGV